MDQFKPGDVVRLKSGGPSMVIARENADDYTPPGRHWTCTWMLADGTEKWANYPEAVLVKAQDP